MVLKGNFEMGLDHMIIDGLERRILELKFCYYYSQYSAEVHQPRINETLKSEYMYFIDKKNYYKSTMIHYLILRLVVYRTTLTPTSETSIVSVSKCKSTLIGNYMGLSSISGLKFK